MFLSSILAKFVTMKLYRGDFQPTSPKGLVFVAYTDFVYSKTSKIRTPIFRNTGLFEIKLGHTEFRE